MIQNHRRGRLFSVVRLLLNNTRPHVSHRTQELLKDFGWTIVPHPPYSPNLAPCDYYLFPKLKGHHGGLCFCVPTMKSRKRLLDFSKGWQNSITWLKKRLNRNDDYVEKKRKFQALKLCITQRTEIKLSM